MEPRSTVGDRLADSARRTGLEALAAVLRPRGEPPTPAADSDDAHFGVTVDGVPIAVEARGKGARLTCVLAERTAGEVALRALMAQYFRYADRGADVLCVDGQGRLLLVADFTAGEDAASFAASFCDAAVHWHAMARRSAAERPRLAAWPPAQIFP